MLIYYIPIYITFISSFIFLLNDKKIEFVAIILITCFVALISGMRLYSDIDFNGYIELYNHTPFLVDFNLSTVEHLYGELGYLFITSAIKSAGADFVVVTLLFSLLSIGLKSYFFFRFTDAACIGLSFYLCISFITVEFITLRWSIASSLIILGYYKLYKGHFHTAFLFLLSSVLFHYFSIAFIALTLLMKINNFNLIKLGFVSAFVVGLLLKVGGQSFNLANDNSVYMVQTLFRYLNTPDSNVGLFSYLKALFIPLLYILYTLVKKGGAPMDYKIKFLAKWSFVFTSFAFLFASIPIFFFRISVISDLFSLALLINIARLEKRIEIRYLLIFIISVFFSVWCFLDVNNNISGQRIFEYETWWSLYI
tara:strand:- start:15273 stop:16373 length:1101 start_codon:yes stop_codon:yes gene_type:complete